MFDLLVISLFFSMVLAPCVVASVSTHFEGKAGSLARKAGESPVEAKV
jgi:hypothetical protein